MTRHARRASGEDGVALVELALVMSLLILVVFGVVEFGSAWSNKLKIETAARAGARVGAASGASRLADYSLLESVKSVLEDLGLEHVDYVVVYKVTTAQGKIPPGCGGSNPTSQAGVCNVYPGETLASLDASDFAGTTTCASSAPDHWWCPTSRQDVQHLGTDFLGVYIKASSPTLTSFFGSPLKLASWAVMQLEPR